VYKRTKYIIVLTTLISPASLILAGCMSIHTAAQAGNVSEVKSQLAWGANPNARTFWSLDTPLQWAAQNGQVNTAKLLLAHGADINQKGGDDKTALMDAPFRRNSSRPLGSVTQLRSNKEHKTEYGNT
jgi:ankyrin repeat protein